MRLRGLVFERFGAFERAELDLCDEQGEPLDVALLVGESGSGKSAILRGLSEILTEAAGAEPGLDAADILRGAEAARCRVVFDDVIDGKRLVITVEKEIGRSGGSLRASPKAAYDRWREAMQASGTARAAFSVAADDAVETDRSPERTDPASIHGDDDEVDPLFEWFHALRGSPDWEVAVRTLDRILRPSVFDHVDADRELYFSSGGGVAPASELGDAFESILVLTLELLRLSIENPDAELVYVIDDLDAHLHPRIQARLLGDLRRTFPRVQIVATTQSPLLVGSVEPQQVFRLGRKGVERVAARIQRGTASSSVMDLAFGAPELAGPRWIHTPPFEIRREVLRSVDDELARGATVYALPEPVHVKDVKNAFGEPVLPFKEGVIGHLFFVDLEPGSSWGHACEYVFRTREGKLTRQRAIWPPTDLDRFVAIGRG